MDRRLGRHQEHHGNQVLPQELQEGSNKCTGKGCTRLSRAFRRTHAQSGPQLSKRPPVGSDEAVLLPGCSPLRSALLHWCPQRSALLCGDPPVPDDGENPLLLPTLGGQPPLVARRCPRPPARYFSARPWASASSRLPLRATRTWKTTDGRTTASVAVRRRGPNREHAVGAARAALPHLDIREPSTFPKRRKQLDLLFGGENGSGRTHGHSLRPEAVRPHGR